MAITQTRVHSSVNKVKFKVTATAAADTTTLSIKTPITVSSSGNTVFSAANNTMTRSVGSWTTDLVTVGSVIIVTTTVSNNGTYIVKSVTPTVITIETNTSVARNYLVDETFLNTVYTGSYQSLFLHYGQIFTIASPKVNIAEMSFSCSSTGDITISRTSLVTHKLFGSAVNFHAPSSENSTADLVVLFSTGAGGTMILELSKMEGFSAVNPTGLPY